MLQLYFTCQTTALISPPLHLSILSSALTMLWVAVCLLLLQTVAAQNQVCQIYTEAKEDGSKSLIVICLAQNLPDITQDEMVPFIDEALALGSKCCSDAPVGDCERDPVDLFQSAVCSYESIVERNNLKSCCEQSGAERYVCFVDHKVNISRDHSLQTWLPTEDECPDFKKDDEAFLGKLIFSLSKRNVLQPPQVILRVAKQYIDVMVSCCGDADPQTCFDNKVTASPEVPVLLFPKSSRELKRQKRSWVIPPINFPENDRGPFPKQMVQIRSDRDKEVQVFYSVTGQGADLPPVGLFTVDRRSGWLYVTQPMDREKQEHYTLRAHAVVVGSGNAEEAMDIIVNIIDMNDEKPTFTQDIFTGKVPQASSIGHEIIKVEAKDLDKEGTANSDIRYSILNQHPKMPSDNLFVINPVSGVITLNGGGLDRTKYPNYILEVQAADDEGRGLTGQAKVILTVTDEVPTLEQTTELFCVFNRSLEEITRWFETNDFCQRRHPVN